jgi:hypothetical protein
MSSITVRFASFLLRESITVVRGAAWTWACNFHLDPCRGTLWRTEKLFCKKCRERTGGTRKTRLTFKRSRATICCGAKCTFIYSFQAAPSLSLRLLASTTRLASCVLYRSAPTWFRFQFHEQKKEKKSAKWVWLALVSLALHAGLGLARGSSRARNEDGECKRSQKCISQLEARRLSTVGASWSIQRAKKCATHLCMQCIE